MTGPLLVIAHEATRTGSPRVLVELLRHCVPRLDVPVAIRVLRGGPLLAEMSSLATAIDGGTVPCAIVVNSAGCASALIEFDRSIPSLVYVHEQGEALAVLDPSAVLALSSYADRVVCVSDASRIDLVTVGVHPDRIVVIPPVIARRSAPSADAVSEARRALGLRPTDRAVVACGEACWRKGTDLFVQLAGRLAADEDLVFGWIGRRPRGFGRVLDHDVVRLRLADRLRWHDEVDDPSALLAAADVLVMTSREDPQPLVPLEAAMVGTPTVGFAIGGLVDFAGVGAVAAVPYPDLGSLAAETNRVLGDVAAASDLVAAARRLGDTERSIEIIGPSFLLEVTSLLQPGTVPRSEPMGAEG